MDHTNNFKHTQSPLIQPKENCIDEASSMRELLPGKSVMRPNIIFGGSSRIENVALFKKNYVKSIGHSPGIFTVQCVCVFIQNL